MPFGVKFTAEKREVQKQDALPLYISCLDEMLAEHGIERGSTLLVSGGCGTGKSTFAMQSVYNGIMENGEKAVYISFEEQLKKLRKHMSRHFGWDLDKLEREKKFALIKADPFAIARSVEAYLAEQKGELLVEVQEINLPFQPDRIIIDSLSALAVAFMGNVENYRYYIRYMFEILEKYNSVNFVISETEQDPGVYSRTGIEEFLADGVIVLYNKQEGKSRQGYLEILKLRNSAHIKKIVPFEMTARGIEISKSKEITEAIDKMNEGQKK